MATRQNAVYVANGRDMAIFVEASVTRPTALCVNAAGVAIRASNAQPILLVPPSPASLEQLRRMRNVVVVCAGADAVVPVEFGNVQPS